MITQSQIHHIVENQRAFFNTHATLGHEFRLNALKTLKEGVCRHEQRFHDALKADLGKPVYESFITETGIIRHDLTRTMKSLKKWMGVKWKMTPFYLLPGTSKVRYTPLGVNLIIAPFNYPMQSTFSPLIAAIAAGNTAVVKTSELTPSVSRVIQNLINDCFRPEHVAYVPGEVEETQMLLTQKFDHIFFTGSTRVGGIVLEAAAKHLTPVTLELGGKSPCIIHNDANLDTAVRRIAYGKLLNTGQTCVAPDYALVHQDVAQPFIDKLGKRIRALYGDNPSQSPDFGRIVNVAHHRRLVSLIDPEKVVIGGDHDEATRYIGPTVMTNVNLHDPVMKEEIFGPILPVMTFRTLDQVYQTIGALPQHPLALYLFTGDRQIRDELVSLIPFGGGCVNHCIQHLANPYLPFGGQGGSGMGHYHGFDGFTQFSHKKAMYQAPTATWLDLPLIYPPYKGKLKIMRAIFR